MTDEVLFSPGELDRRAGFYVAGHRGLVGSAIVRKLQDAGFENIITRTSAEIDAARAAGVERLLFLGSSFIYPKFAEQPIPEDSLLTGPSKPTNDANTIAKIAGILHVQAVRRQ